MQAKLIYLDVAIDVPLAVQMAIQGEITGGFDFAWDLSASPPAIGQLLWVPWGKNNAPRLGVMLGVLTAPRIDAAMIKKVLPSPPRLAQLAPLPPSVLALARFCHQYYHRSLGEILLPTLPISEKEFAQAITRQLKPKILDKPAAQDALALTPLQQSVAAAVSETAGYAPHLIHGITGSGKTEIYASFAAQTLAKGQQVLVLVPEIILVAPMWRRLAARLNEALVLPLHSGLTQAQRRDHWLATLAGKVQVVVGTRSALFAPLENLGLIVVDEEHDASYKQQEGVRYSARDMALVLARHFDCAVVLGSATPSLESWRAAQTGKYALHRLQHRAVSGAALPQLSLLDTRGKKLQAGLTPQAISLLQAAHERGEQSLVFMNRRGFAPSLACNACGWQSECPHCAAYMAVHKLPQLWRLVCHHCATQSRVPKACPGCGNVDLTPERPCTQQIESGLQALLPQVRIGRLDSDINRLAGAGSAVTAAMAAGELDVLVGTQMIAKGHHFPKLSTVIVLGADSVLQSPDFRGQERLYALLTQVAGRAGRESAGGKVYVQTAHAAHPLFQAFLRSDTEGFFTAQLEQRRAAQLPPFGFQAAVRGQHKDLSVLMQELESVQQALQAQLQAGQICYPPAPMLLAKVAQHYRAQVLIESSSRPALQALLQAALPKLIALKLKTKLQWEVDPLDV